MENQSPSKTPNRLTALAMALASRPLVAATVIPAAQRDPGELWVVHELVQRVEALPRSQQAKCLSPFSMHSTRTPELDKLLLQLVDFLKFGSSPLTPHEVHVLATGLALHSSEAKTGDFQIGDRVVFVGRGNGSLDTGRAIMLSPTELFDDTYSMALRPDDKENLLVVTQLLSRIA